MTLLSQPNLNTFSQYSFTISRFFSVNLFSLTIILSLICFFTILLMLSWFKVLLFSWFSVKPLMADFSSLSPYLKLYDLGPVETKLAIPLPESSSVISPSMSPVSMCFVPSSANIMLSLSKYRTLYCK